VCGAYTDKAQAIYIPQINKSIFKELKVYSDGLLDGNDIGAVHSDGVVSDVLSIPARLELDSVGSSGKGGIMEVVELVPVVGIGSSEVRVSLIEVHNTSSSSFAPISIHS
jgi:hypothetical protein